VRLTTLRHPVPLSLNLGTLTSWNPLGHSRLVTGLLYLILNTAPLGPVFLRATLAEFCLLSGNLKFNTKNEERINPFDA